MIADSLFTILLTTAVVIGTIRCFKSEQLFEKLLFSSQRVIQDKEYYRLFTCAFVHADPFHIIFNAITLYLFGEIIEQTRGALSMIAIFSISVVGGSLLSLFRHRFHEYTAVGASAGTSGLVIAYVILCPGSGIGMMLLPGIYLPGFVYAFLFFAGSIYAAHRRHDSIAHDAHIGGGIAGLFTAIILYPQSLKNSPVEIVAMVSLLGFYLFYLSRSHNGSIPFKVFLSQMLPQKKNEQDVMKPRIIKRNRMQRQMKLLTIEKPQSPSVDEILKKISLSGIDSISSSEKAILQEESTRLKDQKE